VTCREFQELISSAVDRYLRREVQEEFDEHARACGHCRFEYEAERSTKQLLRNRAGMVAVPRELQSAILQQIRRETEAPAGGRAPWRSFVRPGIAFVATAVVVLFIVRPPRSQQSLPRAALAGFGPNNVVVQSLENFHKALRGEITPQVVSAENARVREFFSGKTEFPVRVPVMQRCTLIGGVLNQHRGAPLAHLMYRAGGDLIYLYQACWATVQRGVELEVTPEARDALLKTGWYDRSVPDSDAVILWKSGPTLCVAVSHMDRRELLAYLQQASDDTVAPW
jgi:anti-sigma factor (TIGR02949 family)